MRIQAFRSEAAISLREKRSSRVPQMPQLQSLIRRRHHAPFRPADMTKAALAFAGAAFVPGFGGYQSADPSDQVSALAAERRIRRRGLGAPASGPPGQRAAR